VSNLKQIVSLMEEQPLSKSLPAALRIANTLQDQGWASWIRLELMGYSADNPAMTEEIVVPEYRSVSGLWYDDYGRSLIVDDPTLTFINEIRVRQGVAELEGIASAKGPLSMRLIDFSEIIRENLNVDVSIFRFQPSSVSQVLSNIQSLLIDQVCSRQDKIDAISDTQLVHEGEVLQLKPSVYGVGIDLKALWRKVRGLRKKMITE
jgi:hypothetical protein